MGRAAAILVTVVFAGGMLVAGLWLAGDGDERPATDSNRVVVEDPDALSCDEAPRNPQIAANEAWPRTFGGYWIDQSERAPYVAFTEGAEEKVARLAECFPERNFSSVTFERSLQEMETVLGEILADREAIRAGNLELPEIPDHHYSFGLDVRRNVIYVLIEEVTPETTETFSRYGSFVEVVEGDPGGPD